MPEQPPPRHRPPLVPPAMQQRARDLAAGGERDLALDPLAITSDTLAAIACIAAHSWSTDGERDAALAKINAMALGALAQIQGR